MSNNQLPPELQKQISDEILEATLPLKNDNDYDIGYEKGFEGGYESGATKYAIKLYECDKANSALEEKNRGLEEQIKELKANIERLCKTEQELLKAAEVSLELNKVEGIDVFVPCAEDDPESCGAYTSHDGRSLCYVKVKHIDKDSDLKAKGDKLADAIKCLINDNDVKPPYYCTDVVMEILRKALAEWSGEKEQPKGSEGGKEGDNG